MAQNIIRALGYTGYRQLLTWPATQSYNGTVTAYLWGAGGGGGGNDAGNQGGQGGGGGFSRVTVDVNPGDVLEVSVGGPGGGGASSQGGAYGGAPGPSLLLGGGLFNTLGTGLPRVTNGAYCTFLNNYGVWNEPGGGSTIFDRSYTINFPSTDSYTFEASVDNYGYIFLDGVNILNIHGFQTTYATTINVSAGNHTVRLFGVNTGGPGSFGLTISGGAAFCGGYGGRAGWSGSSGGGGGGGGATVLRKNGVTLAVAGGGGGGGGAGIRSGTEPGNAPGPFGQAAPGNNIGGDGGDRSGDGGGGGAGGGGFGGGNGGAQAPFDTWGYAGFYGGNLGNLGINPSGRFPGGTNQPYYPGGAGFGGVTASPGNPGYAVLDFEINGTFVKVDDTWQNVKQVWVKDNNTWYPTRGEFVKVNGIWEPVSGTFAPNFTQVPNQFGYVSRGGSVSTPLVVCVSVIDECSQSASTIQANWNQFILTYPLRLFNLLQPGGPSRGNLKVPSNYSTFRGARGPIAVNRDNGSSASASDWFSICGLNTAPVGTKVILSIDNSGSMTTNTVAASRNLFYARCAANGMPITEVGMPSENWVVPFFIEV